MFTKHRLSVLYIYIYIYTYIDFMFKSSQENYRNLINHLKIACLQSFPSFYAIYEKKVRNARKHAGSGLL